MLTAILSVRSLLLAVFMLMAGSGFMATLISLQLEAAGTSPLFIGPVATAYFAGLTVGALKVTPLIQRVGHIRAFTAFVSLFSASTLTYAVHQDIMLWGALRFVDGFCMAGVFVCLESWLNDKSGPETRGGVLAVYMTVLYSGQAVGQFLLTLSSDKPSMPFLVAGILLSLAVLPIALTRRNAPVLDEAPAMSIRKLYESSPLGIIGAAATGMMLGAFYALGAVHVRRLGMDLSGAALFMSVVILGGVVLQWPIGWLSDVFDRRRVIVSTFAAAVLASGLISLTGAPGTALLVLGGLFGGLTFALYPLCVAHTNDRLSPADRVGASGGLVLAYSVGAVAGPMAGAAAMSAMGPPGLYVFIACCAIGALAFALWRQAANMPVPGELQQHYQILPRTTPMPASLDPFAPDGDDDPAPDRKET
ncbi:MFS transporter [Emcibacter sp. SYSU 3D8]|uniref:MFS transporter n=1 Tax=Emcibacter sp. SYSU 3D8 TaxID=3133969 RepID=UPI0031FF1DF5